MATNKTPPVVEVVWEDATGYARWEDVAAFKSATLIIATTIGYLIHENKERVVVAQTLTTEATSGHTLMIPKKWIKSRKVVRR